MVCVVDDVDGSVLPNAIEVNTTLTAVNNPYAIHQDVRVINADLTIMPGVKVVFYGPFSIICQNEGRILARGLADSPVEFLSSDSASHYYRSIDTGIGGRFTNCTFAYSSDGLLIEKGAYIRDCAFNWSEVGVNLYGPNITIENCRFDSCDDAVWFQTTVSCRFMNCSFDNCRVGFNATDSGGSCTVSSCTFSQGRFRWFDINRFTGSIEIRDSLFEWSDSCANMYRVDQVIIENSTFYKNVHGVSLIQCQATIVNPHMVRRCRFIECNYGLALSATSFGFLTETTFSGCGIALSRIAPWSPSADIIVWRNNFLWNNNDGSFDSGNVTYSWDGSGNYWTKYNGQDVDEDGIGDTPHWIHDDVYDEYPLMSPVDLWRPSAVAGRDISVDQRERFELDGGDSHDDLWLVNWTWSIKSDKDIRYLYGETVETAVDDAGTFEIELIVTDVDGKTDSDSLTLTVNDIDPPTISDITAPPNVSFGRPFTIACTVNDNTGLDGVWVIVRSGQHSSEQFPMMESAPGAFSITYTINSSVVAKISFCIGASDTFENVVSSIYYDIDVRDDDPPVIGSHEETNLTTGDLLTFLCVLVDNVGVRNASIDVWGLGLDLSSTDLTGSDNIWTGTYQLPPWFSGPLTIRYHAVDMAGNRARSDQIMLFVIDNDPPTIEAVSTNPSLDDLRKGDDVTFNVSGHDNVGIDEAYLDIKYYMTDWERSQLTWTDPWFTTTLSASTDLGNMLWFKVGVVDRAGNRYETEDVKVTLKSRAPTIDVSVSDEAFKGKPYQVILEAVDPDSDDAALTWSLATNASWLELDGGGRNVRGTPSFNDIGWYWVELGVDDGDGGNATLRYVLTVHDFNYPPIVTIVSPGNDSKVRGKAVISGRATDDGESIEWVKVQIDDGEWTYADGIGTWEFVLRGDRMSEGSHKITVVAYDGELESNGTSLLIKVVHDDEGGIPGFSWNLVFIALVSSAMVYYIKRH